MRQSAARRQVEFLNKMSQPSAQRKSCDAMEGRSQEVTVINIEDQVIRDGHLDVGDSGRPRPKSAASSSRDKWAEMW